MDLWRDTGALSLTINGFSDELGNAGQDNEGRGGQSGRLWIQVTEPGDVTGQQPSLRWYPQWYDETCDLKTAQRRRSPSPAGE
ncbi:hypothetical protein O9993_15215 [Vibrio lentus]|nr:hypothetical protein [Vibrio lentus]